MQTQESSPARSSTLGHKRWKTYLVWSGAVITSYLLTYGAGYFMGRSEVSKAVEKTQEVTKTLDAMTQTLEAERGHAQRLEARRCLDQAVFALDARNFGIADERLKQASQRLAAAKADGALLELSRALESFKLVATEDLGDQRSKLLAFVSTFDQALPAR